MTVHGPTSESFSIRVRAPMTLLWLTDVPADHRVFGYHRRLTYQHVVGQVDA